MKIIVTGGASGLGESIVRKLSANPDDQVYFTYCHSEERARKLESEQANRNAIHCDFSRPETVEHLCSLMEGISPDVLINNAFVGKISKTHFYKTGNEVFSEGFRLNVLPVIMLAKSALTVFRKKKSGKIITVLSSAIIGKPPVGWSEYVAEKNYLLSLSKSWAVENARFNICSNAVSPSFMATELNADVDERLIEEMTNNHPLKRILQPDEVADAVHYLVNAPAQLNGINLIMNAAENVI